MKQAAASTTTKPSPNAPQLGVGAVALAFLDTTWRIATPVVGMTILGIWADRSWGTKPWLTLLSVVIGFGMAVLLVKSQLAAVAQAEAKK